jgi:serine/threonine protein phosphatase PrpC
MPVDTTADTGDFPTPPPLTPAAPPPSASAQVQVDLGALSHRGKVRANNEDCYLVARVDRALTILLTNLPEGCLPDRAEEVGYGLLVADGMGGMAAGEVASRLAVTSLVRILVHTSDWIMRTDAGAADQLLERIAERYRQVDAALKEEAQADPGLAGMGTTMTLGYSLGADLFLGHIGDSRAYFRRGQDLFQLTRDHTYAQALADLGVIEPEQVVRHRFRHVLTRALGGTAGEVEADVQRARIRDGDQLLLCTDGLTEMVDDGAINAVLGKASSADEACQDLVNLALNHGGKDNVTVVVARYRFGPAL